MLYAIYMLLRENVLNLCIYFITKNKNVKYDYFAASVIKPTTSSENLTGSFISSPDERSDCI